MVRIDMFNKEIKLIGIMLLALAMSACQRSAEEKETAAALEDDPVLVMVNGEAITQKDLDVASLRLLGPARTAQLDDEARRKILDSLVMSRIISDAADAELNAQNRDTIDRQVANYREELLVKHYLRDHVEPQPVTQAMVREHYEKYPERYGARTIRTYELLSANKKLEGTARQNLLKALNDAGGRKDWAAFAKTLNKKGYAVQLKRGKSDEKLLHRQIQLVMSSLKLNDTSRAFLVDGVPHVMRITAEKKEDPRPLNEVSAEIRKALLPGQLKIAVKQVADELKKSAKIEYMNDKAGKEE